MHDARVFSTDCSQMMKEVSTRIMSTLRKHIAKLENKANGYRNMIANAQAIANANAATHGAAATVAASEKAPANVRTKEGGDARGDAMEGETCPETFLHVQLKSYVYTSMGGWLGTTFWSQ